MHPRPTKNETPTLVPDLNRGMTAGMDRVDDNAHLDGTGKNHGTNQGLMRIIGRSNGTNQGHMRIIGRDRGTKKYHLKTQQQS